MNQIEYSSSNFFTQALILGLILLLGGISIFPTMSYYHKSFYFIFLLPSILLLFKQKKEALPKSITFYIFILFLIFSWASISWSTSQDEAFQLIKRGINITFLFIGINILTKQQSFNIKKILTISGILFSITIIIGLVLFLNEDNIYSRFIGIGSLSNPLLTSHITGFFFCYFFALLITSKENQKMKIFYLALSTVFLLTTLLTGSRTPLLAITAATIWISICLFNKKSFFILCGLTSFSLLIILFFPELIQNRGFSYRPELWSSAITQIQENFWLGYGIASNSSFYVPSLDVYYKEPHNIHLSVFYFVGFTGLILWLCLFSYAAFICFKNKKSNDFYIILGGLLIFGITASMTEGGGFLSRPKEHWFIIWIPLALIAAQESLTYHLKKTIFDKA